MRTDVPATSSKVQAASSMGRRAPLGNLNRILKCVTAVRPSPGPSAPPPCEGAANRRLLRDEDHDDGSKPCNQPRQVRTIPSFSSIGVRLADARPTIQQRRRLRLGLAAWGVLEPPAGRASGPTTRTGPPAAGAPPPDPGDSGMPSPAPRPVAHRRPPDRARVGKVVRPVGRSTFPTRARPGRAKLARRDAAPARGRVPLRTTPLKIIGYTSGTTPAGDQQKTTRTRQQQFPQLSGHEILHSAGRRTPPISSR